MKLNNFSVIYKQHDSNFVVIHGWDDHQLVLAFIPRIHLADHFRLSWLSGEQANLLVDANLDAFSSIISRKYDQGEWITYARAGSTLPRVDINLNDIETSGEALKDSVLGMAVSSGWMGADRRWLPE